MKNKIVVRFKCNGSMYQEKIDVLLSGNCKSIFPVNLMNKNEGIIGYYDTLGYKSISKFTDLTAKSALVIAEKVILAMEDCYQYLFFPDEYVLNTNTTFIDHNYNTVKLIYIPDIRSENLSKKYQGFLRNLKEITNENGKKYLDKLIGDCSSESVSINKIKLLNSRLIDEVERYHLL